MHYQSLSYGNVDGNGTPAVVQSRPAVPVQAAAHLQVASLLAMLCDGCRADGQGFNPLPLDRLLWQFGILVSEALTLKDVKLNEERGHLSVPFHAVSCHFMPFGKIGCVTRGQHKPDMLNCVFESLLDPFLGL